MARLEPDGGGPRVCVLGSANMDCVAFVDRPPGPGETVRGRRFLLTPGGKGANQAVAAARAGGRVALAGAVGEDPFGRRLLEVYAAEGLDTGALRVVPGASTGTAVIVVDAAGENAIVVVAGANGEVRDLDEATSTRIAASDLLLLQLELPMTAVVAAARHARDAGVRVVLTPAPVTELPEELLTCVDVLVANQHEATRLTAATEPGRAARLLRDRGPGEVVVTLGARGAVCLGGDGAATRVPAVVGPVVDTTGAGDAFVGALAVALGEDRPLTAAVEFATAAAALSVREPGASTSPRRPEIEALIHRHPGD